MSAADVTQEGRPHLLSCKGGNVKLRSRIVDSSITNCRDGAWMCAWLRRAYMFGCPLLETIGGSKKQPANCKWDSTTSQGFQTTIVNDGQYWPYSVTRNTEAMVFGVVQFKASAGCEIWMAWQLAQQLGNNLSGKIAGAVELAHPERGMAPETPHLPYHVLYARDNRKTPDTGHMHCFPSLTLWALLIHDYLIIMTLHHMTSLHNCSICQFMMI